MLNNFGSARFEFKNFAPDPNNKKIRSTRGSNMEYTDEIPAFLCQPVNNESRIMRQAADESKYAAEDTLTPNPPHKRVKRVNEPTDDFKSPVPLNQPSKIEKNAEFGSPSCSAKVQKRSDPIKWDDYFMAIAFLSSMRSKDPSTQVGACIVNPDKRIVGMGYNGFPRGCSDDELPWCRQAENELDTKYPVSEETWHLSFILDMGYALTNLY